MSNLFQLLIHPPIFCVFACVLSGCGSGAPDGPELIPVQGTVLLDGEPLAAATVVFMPVESTPGNGGFGRTDDEGRFTVTYSSGYEGIPAGAYRVSISRRLMPDGSPVAADDETPPIESPATESLPKPYSDPEDSQLTATIGAEQMPIEFKLSSDGAIE